MKTRNARDVVRCKGASQLDAKILDRHKLQFEFLVNRPVASAIPGKSSGRLALEFTLADIADIRTDHASEELERLIREFRSAAMRTWTGLARLRQQLGGKTKNGKSSGDV